MDKMTMLKSLAPGFLPLVIFIAADALWGVKIGLIVAVAVGLVELVISYIKEKTLDKFVLLDIGLIVVLGVVSIILENDIFFKLKPALIEAIFCVLLGVSVYSPVNIMMMMTKRYMKNMELNGEQERQFERSLKVMFWLFLGHTVMIVYSAFFMSKGAWGFISGGLFYILFGLYFVVELVRNKSKQKKWLEKYRDEEWFDIVDEEGKVIGSAPRTVCHSGPGRLHPVVHIHIIDSKNRVYLQKRPMTKHIQPGKWDTAVGGHVASGENVETALKREAREELNLTDFKPQFVAKYVWETDVESELVFMFIAFHNKAITFNKDEVDDGKFWRIKKIKESLDKKILTPNFIFEFDILLKHVFKEA